MRPPAAFDAAWLDLRAPADHAARDRRLLQRFASALCTNPAPRIVDLGAGTGATLRAVGPVVPDARWTLVDNNPALLQAAQRRAPGVGIRQADLAADLEDVLSGDVGAITASALIDLVSADWLDRLVRAAAGRVIYIALSYDGIEEWHPAHWADADVLAAFQAHQRRDKGFGPALGNDAADALAARLHNAGWTVTTAPSPWRLSRDAHGALMDALADGIAEAAAAGGAEARTAEEWRMARREAESCMIGHTDLLAIPQP